MREVEALLRQEKEGKRAHLASLKEALLDREKALPAHSIRPHQLLTIEALEDEIEGLEKEIAGYNL